MIRFEHLTENEISSHLMKSRPDFTHRKEEFINEYSIKLFKHAEFVTARSYNNSLEGIVAFYANSRPNAYISHVWVAKCRRGGVFVA